MAEKEQDRDWDREMREVDKLLKKLPEADPTLGRGPVRPAAGGPAGGVPTLRTTPYAAGGRGVAATWLRLSLGLLLGVGMLVWPYTHVCGARLVFYLLGVVTLIVAGVWSALASWKHHQGFAHLLSLALMLWGLALAAGVVLPRAGYAGQAATWLCPEPVEPPPNR